MADGLPTGLVTFLMSDVEGSGAHWASDAEAMALAVRHLDDAVAEVAAGNDGTVLKPRGEGDSHFVVFGRPSKAVQAACELQSVMAERRPGAPHVRVRIGIHTGEVDPVDNDYYGIAVNQTARLRSLGHGGQTVLSHVTAALARPSLHGRVRLKSLGHHRVRDFPRLEEIFQATAPGTEDVFPPLHTGEKGAPAVMAVTVVDVCDSSGRLAASQGDQVIAWQRQLAAALRRLAEPWEPAVLKLLGDGCLTVFEDPVWALAFLRDTREEVARLDLEVRSSIEVGRVELHDGDVVGPSAFVASELCKRASPGQIVATATAVELAGATSEAVPLGRSAVRVTGKETELFAL